MTMPQREVYWMTMAEDAVGMQCECALERYVVVEVRPLRNELVIRSRRGTLHTVLACYIEPLLDENRPG